MKKFFLVVALVAAVATSSLMNKAGAKTRSGMYYWYSVNASGQIVSGSQEFGGVQKSVSYAETNLPCPAGTDADCIRGFNSQITSFPTSATGDTSPLQKQN